MARRADRAGAPLWLALLLLVPLGWACDSVGGDVLSAPAGSRGVRVFVRNESKAPFQLEGKIVGVGETGFHAIHSAPTETHSSFGIVRSGTEMARVSYRILRFPDDAQDAKIIVSESGAGGFQARTTDSSWIEVLDVQLF